MVNVSTSRYCAIHSALCIRTVPYQGDWTYFFAYPSGKYWKDFSMLLHDDLNANSIVGRRWEDYAQGDLVFCKVCNGIIGHDVLLAEVTEPNPNVLLEVGYALAMGRLPILLIDENRIKWNRRLLATLESCHYATREQIRDFIHKLRSQPRTIPQEPERKLPMLESAGIFDQSETPVTVYHLRPKLVTDQIKRVDRVLRTGVFKPASTDPSDSVYDEFLPQARKIQEAQLIVASLLSTVHTNSAELNANVALLVGFAIGLGKRTLVLQQSPAPPILDLGTVLRPFETESEASKIAEAWVDNCNKELIGQRAEKRKAVARQEKANTIRGMYLGHPDALQDYRLMEYFIPTKEYDDALNARRSIFIGRRGSGKSANFQAITADLQSKKNVVLIKIAPDEFELHRMGGFLEDEYALANSKLVYGVVWNYVFLTEMVRVLGESTYRLYYSPADPVRSRLFDFYQAERELLSLDFGSRLVAKLQQLSQIPRDIPADSKRRHLESTVAQLRDYKLGGLLRDFARAEKVSYFLAIDDLDKHWRPESKESIELLVGLVAEVDRLQRFFGEMLKIVLFLREDIYEVLLQHDEDLPKRNLLRMEWTAESLKHMIAERVAAGAGTTNEDDNATWLSVFCPHVKNEACHDYIISRALPRPRDVLDFCQRALDQALRNGHDLITEGDILSAETYFSESTFRSIALEYRTIYPKLDEVLLEFAEATRFMGWSEFEKLGNSIIRKHAETVKTWYGAHTPDVHYLSGVLFRIGFIGLAKGGRQLSLFANGRSFQETWGLVRPSPQVEIHPAFLKVLEIKLRDPLPPSIQRRRKPPGGDAQLKLDLGGGTGS